MLEREYFERSLLMTSPNPTRSPAIFLDRDGVIIEDFHYLCDPDKVRLCLGARRLIKEASHHDIPVVVVTNQSGIGRGYFQWHDYELVNERMQELLGTAAPLAAIYANGYGPDSSVNSWRKPSPQMLLQAAIDLNLDLKSSIIVGDRLTDLQAGASAGLAFAFHVLTGHGSNDRNSVVEWYKRFEREFADSDYVNQRLPMLKCLNDLRKFPMSLLKSIKNQKK